MSYTYICTHTYIFSAKTPAQRTTGVARVPPQRVGAVPSAGSGDGEKVKVLQTEVKVKDRHV